MINIITSTEQQN